MTVTPLTHRVRRNSRQAGVSPRVLVCMGSQSDWMSTMRATCEMLDQFGIYYEARILSAHRTSERMSEHARSAVEQGFEVIVAGAGGAAHLPGMMASKTRLPVIGVPVKSSTLSGVDSLYSIVQMPAGIPVATMAIGVAGAKNAAVLTARILALTDEEIARRVAEYNAVLSASVPEEPEDE